MPPACDELTDRRANAQLPVCSEHLLKAVDAMFCSETPLAFGRLLPATPD
jgi:hypothetical protein